MRSGIATDKRERLKQRERENRELTWGRTRFYGKPARFARQRSSTASRSNPRHDVRVHRRAHIRRVGLRGVGRGQRLFGTRAAARIVWEVGTHSPWVSRQLQAYGHNVYVANPSPMYGARRRTKRNDRMDAAYLARLGRVDVQLLHAIRHRGEQTQAHLAQLRARDQMVKTRTQLINHGRGSVKSVGLRLPTVSAEAFAKRAAAHLPLALTDALTPLLTMITTLTAQIRAFDAQLEPLAQTAYPETQRSRQIAGVLWPRAQVG